MTMANVAEFLLESIAYLFGRLLGLLAFRPFCCLRAADSFVDTAVDSPAVHGPSGEEGGDSDGEGPEPQYAKHSISPTMKPIVNSP